MTSDELEALVQRTLGRPVDCEDLPTILRETIQLRDQEIAHLKATITAQRTAIEALERMVATYQEVLASPRQHKGDMNTEQA